MRFRHFSAVKILNGKLLWWVKKWRFSLTKISAPTYSVYAAIKASAGLKPAASYLAPNSKGIRKSSSMAVKVLISFIKLWKSWMVKFALTSSTIVRQIQMEWRRGGSIRRDLKRDSQLSFLKIPKPKIYSFASRVSRKLFLPKFFSGFTQPVNHCFFGHTCKRRGFLRYASMEFFPQSFSFFNIDFFHRLSPLPKYYYGVNHLSMQIGNCVIGIGIKGPFLFFKNRNEEKIEPVPLFPSANRGSSYGGRAVRTSP